MFPTIIKPMWRPYKEFTVLDKRLRQPPVIIEWPKHSGETVCIQCNAPAKRSFERNEVILNCRCWLK